MSLRLVAGGLLILLAAFGAGWVYGASGRSDVERSASIYRQRAQTAEAEAQLLEARMSLFETNFGDARQRLTRAADLLVAVQRQLRESGQAERAGRVEVVLGEIREADRLAGEFNIGAQAAVETTIRSLRAAGAGQGTTTNE